MIYAPLVQGYGENEKVIKDQYEIKCANVSPKMKAVRILKKGEIVKIIKIDRETTFETSYLPEFHVKLIYKTDERKSSSDDRIYGDMQTLSLVNDSMSGSNSFSDPPIFSSEYLRPIGSDGVWWK